MLDDVGERHADVCRTAVRDVLTPGLLTSVNVDKVTKAAGKTMATPCRSAGPPSSHHPPCVTLRP